MTCRRILFHSTNLLVLFSIFHAAQVRAASYSFAFTGVVTAVDSQLAPQFAVGQTISGNYTFDSAGIDTLADPSVGFYEDVLVAANAVFSNGYTVNRDPSGVAELILVDNSNTPDLYDVFIPVNGALVNGASPDLLEFFLQDNNGTMLSSDDLPLTPPTYALAEAHGGLLRFDLGPNSYYVDYNLLSLNAVPEPATAILAIMPCLAALCVRRPSRYHRLPTC